MPAPDVVTLKPKHYTSLLFINLFIYFVLTYELNLHYVLFQNTIFLKKTKKGWKKNEQSLCETIINKPE